MDNIRLVLEAEWEKKKKKEKRKKKFLIEEESTWMRFFFVRLWWKVRNRWRGSSWSRIGRRHWTAAELIGGAGRLIGSPVRVSWVGSWAEPAPPGLQASDQWQTSRPWPRHGGRLGPREADRSQSHQFGHRFRQPRNPTVRAPKKKSPKTSIFHDFQLKQKKLKCEKKYRVDQLKWIAFGDFISFRVTNKKFPSLYSSMEMNAVDQRSWYELAASQSRQQQDSGSNGGGGGGGGLSGLQQQQQEQEVQDMFFPVALDSSAAGAGSSGTNNGSSPQQRARQQAYYQQVHQHAAQMHSAYNTAAAASHGKKRYSLDSSIIQICQSYSLALKWIT